MFRNRFVAVCVGIMGGLLLGALTFIPDLPGVPRGIHVFRFQQDAHAPQISGELIMRNLTPAIPGQNPEIRVTSVGKPTSVKKEDTPPVKYTTPGKVAIPEVMQKVEFTMDEKRAGNLGNDGNGGDTGKDTNTGNTQPSGNADDNGKARNVGTSDDSGNEGSGGNDEDAAVPAGNDPVTKVLLVTYMRGGSSVLGELFNQNEAASYWFEPLDGMYSSMYSTAHGWFPPDIHFTEDGVLREIPQEEEDEIIRGLRGIYGCDVTNIPTDSLSNYQLLHIPALRFKDYIRCTSTQLSSSKYDPRFSWQCKQYTRKYCSRWFSPGEDSALRDCGRMVAAWREGKEPRLPDVLAAKTTFVQTLKTSPFKRHRDCLTHTREALEPKCTDGLMNVCKTSSVIAAKVIRLRAQTVLRLMEEIPGLKVIYYVRDPRGVVPSRKKAGLLSHNAKVGTDPDVLINEAKLLCERMRSDIDFIKKASDHYPGQVMTLKYEDFATETGEVAKKVYKEFLDSEIPSGFTRWQQQSLTSGNVGGAFSTVRKNSTLTAYKWRQTLSQAQQTRMTSICRDVLELLGYPI